jgi:hypothetical protein
MQTDETKKFVELLGPICDLNGKEREEYLSELKEVYISKKKQWAEEHKSELQPRERESLMDCVIRILYRSNLGIKDGMQIHEKTEDRLVTRFTNDCPILSACQELGLNTRLICREIFHEPYQALLSEIDCKLRFDRDYDDGIRTRSGQGYCEEIITREKKQILK